MSALADAETQRAIEQLLYREARLLDERRHMEWLELWHEEARISAPVRENVETAPGRPPLTRDEELEMLSPAQFFEDDKLILLGRVVRQMTGKAWSENPLTRSCRVISNVEVEAAESEGEFNVFSNSVHYRSRRDGDLTVYPAARRDIVVSENGSFLIRQRLHLYLTDVLPGSFVTFL